MLGWQAQSGLTHAPQHLALTEPGYRESQVSMFLQNRGIVDQNASKGTDPWGRTQRGEQQGIPVDSL